MKTAPSEAAPLALLALHLDERHGARLQAPRREEPVVVEYA
jgi:hypothetical protein